MSAEAEPRDFEADRNKLEIVMVCVGFDDMLQQTITAIHAECDHLIVVTAHEDERTINLCHHSGVTCVPTDLIFKNGRKFNKGAAINAGFGYFQCSGWRLHIDADILLPTGFRRTLFAHTHLERDCLYGARRRDVYGLEGIRRLRHAQVYTPQHVDHTGMSSTHGGYLCDERPSSSSYAYVSNRSGYVPIGFFQLWHASKQRSYPYSLGTAAHDDVLFGELWPESKRRMLPTVEVYHICSEMPVFGRNWEGRRSARLDGKEAFRQG